jgi:hypothetical protein
MANKYFHEALIPSAATETLIYEVPTANTAVVRSLRVTNAGSGSTVITVTQYDSGDATAHYLLKSKPLSVSTTMDVFNGVPCVLEEGDTLKVTSSLGSCHFYLSYLEMDRN